MADHKLDSQIAESLQRLIHIELKVDALLQPQISQIGVGHPDQVFGGRTYAQHGDDLIALCLFHGMGIHKPSYLDIGAHHPFNISNTALFYQRGGRGVNVEPNPNLYANFLVHRPEDTNVNVGVSDFAGRLSFYMIDDYSGRNSFDKVAVETFCAEYPQFCVQKVVDIEVLTGNDIVSKYCGGIFPDFLSVDVEGLDERIIKSLDFTQSRPKVICVEVENAKGSGAKGPIFTYLTQIGYQFVIRAVSNLIFIDSNYHSAIGD